MPNFRGLKFGQAARAKGGRTPIVFSKRAFRFTGGYHLDANLMCLQVSDKAARREMLRVFQVANRRIQNINSSGLPSPAVQSIGADVADRYSFFHASPSWGEMQSQYARAVSFLNQPTSTLTGTKEYLQNIITSYGLTEKDFQYVIDYMQSKSLDSRSYDYVDRYLMNYKDFTGDFEQAVSDVSEMLESDAERLTKALERQTRDAVDNSQEMIAQKEYQTANELIRQAETLEAEAARLDEMEAVSEGIAKALGSVANKVGGTVARIGNFEGDSGQLYHEAKKLREEAEQYRRTADKRRQVAQTLQPVKLEYMGPEPDVPKTPIDISDW